MKKIFLVFGACCVIAAAFVLVFYMRQEPGTAKKIYRIGIPKPVSSLIPALEGFKAGMQQLGYEEGKNILYTIIEEIAPREGAPTQLSMFVETQPDLIYALGVNAAREAKETTARYASVVPVLFAVVSDPTGNKLIAGMRSSGNNLTGITGGNEIIAAKRVELFLELVPNTKRIIFLWNNPLTTGIESVREVLLRHPSTVLVEQYVENEAAVDAYLANFEPKPGDAFFRAPDSVLARRTQKFIEWTLARGLPLVGTNYDDAASGALMSYGANFRKVGIQAAELADRILHGAAPAALPVATPERFELVLNTDIAKQLNLTFTPDALANVDLYVP